MHRQSWFVKKKINTKRPSQQQLSGACLLLLCSTKFVWQWLRNEEKHFWNFLGDAKHWMKLTNGKKSTRWLVWTPWEHLSLPAYPPKRNSRKFWSWSEEWEPKIKPFSFFETTVCLWKAIEIHWNTSNFLNLVKGLSWFIRKPCGVIPAGRLILSNVLRFSSAKR